MAICASCGNEVPERSRFCNTCGAALAQAAPSREQRKIVTILFCDVTGSTELGEKLDPEALRALLARYFERMKEIVESHGGTVEKFIGDAVMAVFGIPTLHEDDALRALRAAREMVEAFPGLGVTGRIGVMTGEVVTGTEERLATGDAVNVAARLEQAAAPGEVLLGEETFALARDAIDVEQVEPLTLKGKSEAVAAYRLLAVRAGEGFARQLDAPMIGRETELRRLRDAFDQAVRDRSCQLFSVLGAAGVGKSRLTAELVASLDGARLVRGRCLPYGEGITYWPVVEVVKQLPDVELAGDAAGALRSLLGESTRAASADEIAWAVRKLLEAAASERPLVCVLDDIHWGEDTFLDLVEHVAGLSRQAPILLLCMGRPELLDRRPGWGGGMLNSTTVLLEPLAPDETERLIASLGDLDESLRARVQEAAEGNPLFVEQMVALVRDSGDARIVVPPTIQALLAARLDQLDPSERSVLEVGSVEGRIFHRGTVQALSPEEPLVSTRLTALVRKELVRPDTPQLPGDDAFRFRHLLIRDAAYDSLPKSIRADLHSRFAAWLEMHGAGLVELDEIVGYHLEQAWRYHSELGSDNESARVLAAEARSRLAGAGRRALARADGAAPGLLERAVRLVPPGEYDIDLERDLIDALFFGGRPGEIDALATSLAERAAAKGDRVGELRALLAREHTAVYIGGRLDGLAALLEEARPILETSGDPRALFEMWEAIATVAHSRIQWAVKLDAAERAAEYARVAGDARLEARMRPHLSGARYFGPTPVADALAWIRAQEDAGSSHPAMAGYQAQLLTMLGRFDEARAVHELNHARVLELGAAVPQAISYQTRADLEWLAGDPEAAVRWARDACDRVEAMGHVAWLSTFAGYHGLYLCGLGRYDEADRWAQKSKDLGASDDVATQMIWRRARAFVRSHHGEHREAEDLLREALALADASDDIDNQGWVRMDLAAVLDRAGRTEETPAIVANALALFEQKGDVVMIERARKRLAAPAKASQ